jgi:hypothetical protein
VVFIWGTHRSCGTPVDPHSSRGCEDHAAFAGRVLDATTKEEVGPEEVGLTCYWHSSITCESVAQWMPLGMVRCMAGLGTDDQKSAPALAWRG